QPSGGATWVWWSHDGRYLVVAGDRFRLWQVDGPKPRQVLEEKAGGATYNFTAHSPRFYVIPPGPTFRLFDLPSCQLRASCQVPASCSSSAPHPSKPLLALGTALGIYLVDLTTGRQQACLPPIGHVGWVAWHPDGQVLATSSLSQIVLWDVPSCRRLRV